MKAPGLLIALCLGAGTADDPWVVYEGGEGPGKGKHVVFVTGDDEYRSEEGMPQMARILARHHGFKCTVLFAIDRNTGDIKPDAQDNIPGLQAVDKADLVVLFLRFRKLPDDQMIRLVDYFESGRPIVALRTSTHAFNFGKTPSAYRRLSWDNKDKEYEGGFGRQVLGETWVAHHGAHGKESTRGIIAEAAKNHPIVRGCEDIWGPTDVYTVRPPADCTTLVLGQVLKGMKPGDPPVDGPKNNPMMPLAWIRNYTWPSGKTARTFTTTMGSSTDLQSEGLRRLVANACYWAVGMEDKIPAKSNVEIVGEYTPTPFGFGTYKKGVKPTDLRMK